MFNPCLPAQNPVRPTLHISRRGFKHPKCSIEGTKPPTLFCPPHHMSNVPLQSASRSRPGSGGNAEEYRSTGAIQGNDAQPWLDRPLTEAPIESVQSSPHNEPSPRRSPPVLLTLVTHPPQPVSPALSSLSIDGWLAQLGETGPIDPREPQQQPSPNPHAHPWYSPGLRFGAVYDPRPLLLRTSALGIRISPQDTSFSMLHRTTQRQSSLSADGSILTSRSSSSYMSANSTFGAHWGLTLPGRRGFRSFDVYPSERIAQSPPHRTY